MADSEWKAEKTFVHGQVRVEVSRAIFGDKPTFSFRVGWTDGKREGSWFVYRDRGTTYAVDLEKATAEAESYVHTEMMLARGSATIGETDGHKKKQKNQGKDQGKDKRDRER